MTFLDLALSYVARGWYVFPLQTRGKFPRIPKADGGQGFKDATLDPEQITSWWTKWPNANVGIACGALLISLILDTSSPTGTRVKIK